MKTVLVTGAGRRLGRAIAEGLASAGRHVLVHYNASSDAAEDCVRGIRERGGSADVVACDLADRRAVDELIQRCNQDRLVTELVNSAALFEADDPACLDLGVFDRQMQVNLAAPMILAQNLYLAVRAANASGAVVNILDNKLFALNPDHASYTTAKAGLAAATQMMAMRFAPELRVNGVGPGITLPAPGQSDAAFERAQKMNPLARGVTPADIVAAVRFFLDTPAVTGQSLAVDSGQNMTPLGRDVSYVAGND